MIKVVSEHKRQIIIESHLHHYREGGFRVDIARDKRRQLGGTVITLQGGLTDNLSRSMGVSDKDISQQRGLANALIEASDGEFIVAAVATVRPGNLFKRLSGSARSRTHRSKANAGAAKYMADRFEADRVIMAGQSLGGISAIDGALHRSRQHSAGNSPVSIDGVVTIDSPGVFGPLKYDGSLAEGLIVLAKNCYSDMEYMSIYERAKFLGPHVLNLAGPLEYAYVMNEIEFTHEADFSHEIDTLRRAYDVPVSHVFHQDDCIPGAEVESPYSASFPGGHVRFMYEPEPVAEHIAGFVDGLRA